MSRLPLADLERRCQKPDYRRVGNWMARRVSRPLALRVTWVVQSWGISAHATTGLAGLLALGAAISFGCGPVAGWLAAALLLQLWYLLDHVDGQLARLHGASSLDGVQLDYLMHHAVNLLVPWGVGFGLAGPQRDPVWLVLGLAWSLGLLLIGIINDTRYKAFIARLKEVEGELSVAGGGSRCEPSAPLSHRPLRLLVHMIRKACEIHVVMNALTLIAVTEWVLDDTRLMLGRGYLVLMAPLSLMLVGASILRSLSRGDCEREFAAWYRVPSGCSLTLSAGRWKVEPGATE
jgi:CDP-alcohol phosphatidyltransferase-like enzyme